MNFFSLVSRLIFINELLGDPPSEILRPQRVVRSRLHACPECGAPVELKYALEENLISIQEHRCPFCDGLIFTRFRQERS